MAHRSELRKIGNAVAKQVAFAWLAEKKPASRRGLDQSRLVGAASRSASPNATCSTPW